MRGPLSLGSWIGIVGGGQLGRMLAMEARRMGYRTCVFDPEDRCPAGQIADRQVARPYTDREALAEFARSVEVATFEFEHVGQDAIEVVTSLCSTAPGVEALLMKRERTSEKDTLTRLGFPVARYEQVKGQAELRKAMSAIGLPAVLKTVAQGYDGKGQAVLSTLRESDGVLERLAPAGSVFVLEEFVSFDKELSVIVARDAAGHTRCFPVVENVHQRGILDVTIAPARVPLEVAARAQALADQVARTLNVVGLVALELFLLKDGGLLINELAFRPHNSGHYTLEGCGVSQFEQLLRILAGLPLGSTELARPTVMANLLGDLWAGPDGQPDIPAALEVPGVRVHLYGKAEARPGRKMGHVTAVASTVEVALERALTARERMKGGAVAAL